MERIIPRLLIFCFIAVFFTQCKKENEDFVVYGPPTQSITFSDVSDLIIDSLGKTVNLKAKINATEGLDKVEIIYADWSVNKTITAFSSANATTIDEAVTIPAAAALKVHAITIKATDKKGGTNFTEVKIGLQNLNYAKLYMADVETDAALSSDLFGVPLVMDKIGAHTFQVTYYARSANVKVRFIPSKTTFTPVAIGLDPTNSSKLVTEASKSLPIILPTIGYYKIVINTLLLSYTVEKAATTGTAYNQVAIAGRGFVDYPAMNFQNALPNIILLDKDPVNPFLFTKVVNIGIPSGRTYATTQFLFTTNNGWTNFWRFDNRPDPEKAVFGGGTEAEFPITSTPVSYLFIFDSFTQRVQVVRQ